MEVGRILLDSGVPTIVLQAGVVIGSGSTSFEMIRHLTEVLPYMPAPRWVRSLIQPIAVRDVLHYLLRAAEVPPEVNRAFDIGGPDVCRYGQIMNGYAVEAGLPQRPIAALPVLTPWLAGQWVNLVTPIPRRLARADHRVAAVRLRHARARHRRRHPAASRGAAAVPHRRARWRSSASARARWRRAGATPRSRVRRATRCRATPTGRATRCTSTSANGGRRRRRRTCGASSRASAARTGGTRSRSRGRSAGWVDKLVGGVGLRRGRRDPDTLHVGDAVDFWRVEAIERGTLPAAARRDAGAGSRLARARLVDGAGCRGLGLPATRGVLPARASRVACTGGRSSRSTASSSRAWRTGSRPRPRRRPRHPDGGPTKGNETVTVLLE